MENSLAKYMSKPQTHMSGSPNKAEKRKDYSNQTKTLMKKKKEGPTIGSGRRIKMTH